MYIPICKHSSLDPAHPQSRNRYLKMSSIPGTKARPITEGSGEMTEGQRGRWRNGWMDGKFDPVDSYIKHICMPGPYSRGCWSSCERMRWRLANARRLAPVIGMHVRFGVFWSRGALPVGGVAMCINGRVYVCR